MTFDELFTFQNLYCSYLKARKGKRHKKDVIQFESNLSNSLWNIKNELDNNSYKIEKYNHFLVYEPKIRDVDAIGFKDRVVQHCLVDYYLMPLLERKLIFDNGACRKNKGTDFSRNRLKMFLVDYYRKSHCNNGYFLKLDFHQYFASIDHDILKRKIENIVDDKRVLNLIFSIIDSFNSDTNKGLPLGNQTSQCLALYYIDEIDRLIKERYQIKYYTRYMDDLIAISDDKDKLNELLKDIIIKCNKLKLSLNVNKTFIKSLTNSSISYLGFTYRLHNKGKISIKVINERKRRFYKYANKKVDNEKLIKQYKKYLEKIER